MQDVNSKRTGTISLTFHALPRTTQHLAHETVFRSCSNQNNCEVKDRPTGQRTRRESPEINLHGCGQFIYSQRVKNIQPGKCNPLSKQCRKTGLHTKEWHWTQYTLHIPRARNLHFSMSRPSFPGSSEDGLPPTTTNLQLLAVSCTQEVSPLLPSLHFSLTVFSPWDLLGRVLRKLFLSAWTQCHVVLKLKPQQILRRPSTDSADLWYAEVEPVWCWRRLSSATERDETSRESPLTAPRRQWRNCRPRLSVGMGGLCLQ